MEKIHFQNIAKVEETNWWYRGKREILLAVVNKLKLPKSATALEVGCGTGLFLKLLESTLRLKCYGLEPEKGFFRLASSRLPGHISNLKLDKFAQPASPAGGLVRSKQSSFPHHYDLITCLDTLEHIKDDQKAVSQMASLLKTGGVLLLYCPAYQFLWSTLDNISHHFHRYTKKELLTLTAGSGLSPVFSSYSNFFLFPPILVIRFLSHLFGRDLFFDPTGLKPYPPLINSLFYHLFTAEKRFLANGVCPERSLAPSSARRSRRIIASPPFGVSVLVIARK